MDDLIQEFVSETEENLQAVDDDLLKFERNPQDAGLLDEIFRLVHTVKGSCGFVGLPRLEALAHAAETLLGNLRDGKLTVTPGAVTAILDTVERIRQLTSALARTGEEPEGRDADLIAKLEVLSGNRGPETGPEDREITATGPTPETLIGGTSAEDTAAERGGTGSPQSIRVSVELLEELMTSVSELVLTRNQLLQEHRHQASDSMAMPLDRLSAQIGRLQDSVMRTRMQPISGAWSALPKLVRTLALDLGKRIELETEGGDTELDRQMLELVKDPLAHMVRNAADHGIEAPDVRREAGKPETGTIRLCAAQEGGHITIRLSDDGQGLDPDRLRRRAIETGLMSHADAAATTETQLTRLIFAPGFSTARTVTNVSGRGVGMDVVRSNVERIGGTIEVETMPGRGTTFLVRIPLTLAIMPALIVGSAGVRFAVPQIAVAELVRTDEASEHRMERVAGTPVLRLRGKLLPLVDLGEALGLETAENADHVLVIRSAGMVFGILVDSIYDTEELVVKPVSKALAALEVYCGNAILGDGSVIMILDPNGLAGDISLVGTDSGEEPENEEEVENDREALLLFRSKGETTPCAVPLSLVARIEDIDAEDFERSGGEWMVQLRGALVPIVAPDADWRPPSEGRQPALLFTRHGKQAAFAVDEVLDIVESKIKLELSSDDPASLGTAVVAGRATNLIDIAYLLRHRLDPAKAKEDAPRILVVDDSPFVRNMLGPLLAEAGYRATIVADVDEALTLRDRGERFDMILSDAEMPGAKGLEFARTVKAGGPWSGVPLLALASLGSVPETQEGRAAGFDRYVVKFDRQTLLQTLGASFDKERAA
ncbi:hypothetical protein B5C34_00370 [Pacificimonas flava]|uniref:Chemotaxis protein CheA n=2 Tax=Pacificimonas TaxID=1960290 RepID=A0A219B162_9SPHN|nr:MULTISPECIES: hybrid sensor histidine kinase/response regulator [Pacificimonas]MBZ6378335.1 hybrid sensor histidine kinase/response regulator [Pacificimonas aurantium]OWV32060.1 hypothetical protein B5C34_00370 [Pacificimonas flava]